MSGLIVPEPEDKPPSVDPEAVAMYYDAPSPARCTECWNLTQCCTCTVVFRRVVLPLPFTREDFDRAAGGNLGDAYRQYVSKGITNLEAFLES